MNPEHECPSEKFNEKQQKKNVNLIRFFFFFLV